MNKIIRIVHVLAGVHDFVSDVMNAVDEMQELGLEVDIKYTADSTYSALILGRKEMEGIE